MIPVPKAIKELYKNIYVFVGGKIKLFRRK